MKQEKQARRKQNKEERTTVTMTFSKLFVLFTLFLYVGGDIFAAAMSTSFRTSAWNGRINNDSGNNRAAVIFLHGLGDTAVGWSSLERTLPSICPRLGNDLVTYVFPQAPTISITLNGGMRLPGWFDLYDWPIDATARDDKIGQLKAVRMLEDTVEQLEREEGIPASRVVVGGFAQGGAVALLAAYNRRNRGKVPYAGCICLSGWLPMRQHFSVNPGIAEMTPLFWAHGKYDEKILFEQQVLGVQRLRDRGVEVTTKVYPVGHESCNSQEIEAMADFLDDVLFPKVEFECLHPPFVSQPSDTTSAEFLASLRYLFQQNTDHLGP